MGLQDPELMRMRGHVNYYILQMLYIFICSGLGDGWGMKPAIGRHDILKVS